MSEEASAFARGNDPSDRFPIVSDDTTETEAAVAPRADGAEEASAAADVPEFAIEPGFGATRGDTPDPDIVAGLLGDGRQFLAMLIGILADKAQHGAGDKTAVGVAVSRLGQGLAESEDEESLFQSLVDALDRRRLEAEALRGIAPIVAAFLARSVGRQGLRDEPESDADKVDDLAGAAEQVVNAALDAGGARAWRRLPDIAATIAGRAAQRALPLGALAEALPRLAARFGAWPRDAGGRDRVISLSDHPRGDLPRGGAADEPRRMVISGPVEIVILDR
jgi:hypothetical protein